MYAHRVRPEAFRCLQILLGAREEFSVVCIVIFSNFGFDETGKWKRRARIELRRFLERAQGFIEILNIKPQEVKPSVIGLGGGCRDCFAGAASQIQSSRDFTSQRTRQRAFGGR